LQAAATAEAEEEGKRQLAELEAKATTTGAAVRGGASGLVDSDEEDDDDVLNATELAAP
jgi:hypothetical protein